MLNSDVIGLIVRFAAEHQVIRTLKPLICPKLYASFYKPSKTLIYGEIQSGKTAHIIAEIKKSILPVVLIIQNNNLVQKQYDARFREAGISCQFVNRHTITLNAHVIVLMNNQYQFAKYKSMVGPNMFLIILDESDLTLSHPLREKGMGEIHVTATPFRYKKHYFDQIQFIEKPPDYYGLDKVQLKPIPTTLNIMDYSAVVDDFLTSQGILLINTFTRIEQMKTTALNLSMEFPTIPVILLTTDKGVYLNRVVTKMRGGSLSALLDTYNEHPHVIILANRMATRGVSFTNSTYTKHITHQVTKSNTITGFLQKCRILGVYPELPQLTLYIETKFMRRFEKYKRMIANHEDITKKLLKVGGDDLYRSILY